MVSRGAARECSPGREPGVFFRYAYPGLAPGATLCRRSAAEYRRGCQHEFAALQRLQERDEILPILVRQIQPKGMSFHSRDAARVKPLLECLYCAAVLQRTAVPHTSK